MLEASRELTDLLKRYADALDEISHRDLAKAADALKRRAAWLRSSHPSGPPNDDGEPGVRVGP